MRELSLFTGGMGGVLGTYGLLGWRPIGYVEIDDYCQRLIAQRIKDGIIPEAPVFGDIRTFISEGYASSYQGMVDVITGGDPCQANSNANRFSKKIAQSLGAEFIQVIRIVRPTFVIRENPARVKDDAPYPSDRFAEELESLGYSSSIVEIRACCMGADHERARLFVLAKVQDSDSKAMERDVSKIVEGADSWRYYTDIAGPDWWSATPRVCRKSDGVAHKVDRLKAIGNGQVPRVVAAAGRLLS